MMRLRIFKITLLLLLAGCFPVRDFSTSNLSSLYRVEEKAFHPEFAAFNISDSLVHLYIKLQPAEFLFSKQPDDKFRAFALIRTELIPSYEDAKVLSDRSELFSFDMSEKEKSRIVEMNVPAP